MKLLSVHMRDSLTNTASKKTIDAILNNVTDQELAVYFANRAKMNPGMVWDGVVKPMLQAMDKKTRDEVKGEITNYGNELATSKAIAETAASGLIFGGENEDDEEVEGQAIVEGSNEGWTIDAINNANRKHWKQKRSVPLKGGVFTPDAINRANTTFWKK